MPRIILLNIPEVMEELDKKVREHYFSKDNEESAENAEQSTSEDAKGHRQRKKARRLKKNN